MDPQPSAVSNGNVNTPSASTSFYLPVFSIHINQTSSPPHNSYLAAYYQRLFTPELLFQTIKEGKLTFIQLAFETRYTPIDLSLVRENSKKQLESVISKQIEILLKQEIKSYQAEAIRKYLNEFSSQEAKVKILNQDLNVAVNTGCATVLKYYERNYLKKWVSCVRQGDVLEYKGNACALTNNDGETKLQLNQFVSRLALDTQGLLQNNAKLYHLAFQADAQNPAAFRQHLIKTRDRLSQEESTAEAQYKYYEKGRLQFEMEVGSNDEIRRVEREQRIKVHDFLENWQEGAPSNLEKTLFNLFGLKKTDPDFEKEFENIFHYPDFDFRNKKLLYFAVAHQQPKIFKQLLAYYQAARVNPLEEEGSEQNMVLLYFKNKKLLYLAAVHQQLEIFKQLLAYYQAIHRNPLEEEDSDQSTVFHGLIDLLNAKNGKTAIEKLDFILAALKALFSVVEEIEKTQASSSNTSSDSLIKKAREKVVRLRTDENKSLLYLSVVHQQLEIFKQLLTYYQAIHRNPLEEEDSDQSTVFHSLIDLLNAKNGKTAIEKLDFILAALKALFSVVEEIEKTQASSSNASSGSLIKKAREKVVRLRTDENKSLLYLSVVHQQLEIFKQLLAYYQATHRNPLEEEDSDQSTVFHGLIDLLNAKNGKTATEKPDFILAALKALFSVVEEIEKTQASSSNASSGSLIKKAREEVVRLRTDENKSLLYLSVVHQQLEIFKQLLTYYQATHRNPLEDEDSDQSTVFHGLIDLLNAKNGKTATEKLDFILAALKALFSVVEEIEKTQASSSNASSGSLIKKAREEVVRLRTAENKGLLYLSVEHQRLDILKQLLVYYRMGNSNPLEEDNEKVPLLHVLLHPLDIENEKTKTEKLDFILAALKALFGVAEEVEKSQASSSKASSDSLIKKAREKIREFFYKTNHLEKTVMEIVLEKNQSRLIDYVLKSHIEPQRSDLCLSLQQNKTSQRLSLFLKSAYEIMQNYEDELRKREEYYENTLQGLRQGGKWDEFDDETISLENTSPDRCLLRRRDLNALWLAWDLAIYLRNDQHFAQEVFLRADRAKSYISLSQGSKLFDPLCRLATQFMHYEIDGQGRKKELIVSNKERREIEKIKNQSQQQHSEEMRQVMARLDAQEARHRTQGEAQEARHRTQGEAQEARHREEMHVQAQQLLILMSMLTPEQQERIRQSMAAATTPSHPRSASDTGASSVFRSSAGLPPKKTAAASASSSSHPASPPSSEPEPQRSRTPIFTFFGEEEGGEGIEPLPSSREGGYAELVDSDSEEGTSPRTGQQGKRKT